MAELFTLSNFFTLLMLVLLQAVLGFDNLLYVSLESRRVAPSGRPGCGAGGSVWPSPCA